MKYIIFLGSFLTATLSYAKMTILTNSATQLHTDVTTEGTDVTKQLAELEKLLKKVKALSLEEDDEADKIEEEVERMEEKLEDIYNSGFLDVDLDNLKSAINKSPYFDTGNPFWTLDNINNSLRSQIKAFFGKIKNPLLKDLEKFFKSPEIQKIKARGKK